MSEKHLAAGSECPPKQPGKLRLYSMKFCPFAQRSRMVLIAKNIPHDVVNINLKNKPEWLFDLHPEGRVPILDVHEKVIVESTDICDWLDEQYQEVPLYPSDPEKKAADKALINSFGSVINIFGQMVHAKEEERQNLSKYRNEILTVLEPFDNELGKRGTYFGGEKPCMVDYIIWPFAERARGISLLYKQDIGLPKDKLNNLRKWREAMKEQPAVKATASSPEQFAKIVSFNNPGVVPDYDSV